MRSIKAIKFIVFLIIVSFFGLMALSGCSEKPESKAQKSLDESTHAALGQARDGLSSGVSPEADSPDDLQQARERLASAISKNRKAPALDGAVFAKGNITFAQAQKLHALLQSKSIPVTKAADRIIVINDRTNELATQKSRLQDMVQANNEYINQLNLNINGQGGKPGIRQMVQKGNAELAKLGGQKSDLAISYNEAQSLASDLQNQANRKLRMADGASGDEKVKLSTEGLDLQRKSNTSMIEAQRLGNQIELLESRIAIAKPLNEKQQKDMKEMKDQINELSNSSDFAKLKSQLRDVSGQLGQSQNELDTAVKTLSNAKSDYASDSEEMITLLKAAIEDYEKVRSRELRSAASERIAISYFWIASVCAENVTLAKHAVSIVECIPQGGVGLKTIIEKCTGDTLDYSKRAFESYDLATEKYGQVNAGSEHGCYIVKQQILTLYGKIVLAEAIAEYDISGDAADALEPLLVKAEECDPDFSKTMTSRLVEGETDSIPVLSVDNTSYYEDIRKLFQEHAWPKLPVEEREGAVNILLADLAKLETEDTFDRQTFERILGPEKLKLENALKRGFEDFGDDALGDPNLL